jgi:cell division protein FtsZ
MQPVNLFENVVNIKVFGVGGAGGNAINRMIRDRVTGISYVAVNTDAQALEESLADRRLQIGKGITKGLGAGGDPKVGEKAIKEQYKEIQEELENCDLVFVTAGLGGGTGSGAAPWIARFAKERDILCVAVVTKPFTFEGARRNRIALQSAEALIDNVDTYICVPNERLVQQLPKGTSMKDSFSEADRILRQGVQGISDIILNPGLINVDFADVDSVLRGAGRALLGVGVGVGEQRAKIATSNAVNSPLLETSIAGARRILVNISAGRDFSIGEAEEVMDYIMQFVHPDDGDVFLGHSINENSEGAVKVTVLAADLDPEARGPRLDPEVFDSSVRRVAASDQPREYSSPNREITIEEIQSREPERPAHLDDVEIDIPTYLKQRRSGGRF